MPNFIEIGGGSRKFSKKLVDIFNSFSYDDTCKQSTLLKSKVKVPVRVNHVAIGESSKELAKPNLWILAILAKSINTVEPLLYDHPQNHIGVVV